MRLGFGTFCNNYYKVIFDGLFLSFGRSSTIIELDPLILAK